MMIYKIKSKSLICGLKVFFEGYKFSFENFQIKGKWKGYEARKVARFEYNLVILRLGKTTIQIYVFYGE
jgi:hypothetical protein